MKSKKLIKEPYSEKPNRIIKHNEQHDKVNNTKNCVLFSLVLMISITMLFIANKIIYHLAAQFDMSHKQETFLYIVALVVLLALFIYFSS